MLTLCQVPADYLEIHCWHSSTPSNSETFLTIPHLEHTEGSKWRSKLNAHLDAELDHLLHVIFYSFSYKDDCFLSYRAIRCAPSSQGCPHIPLLFLYLYLCYLLNALPHPCFGRPSASFSTLPDWRSRKKCVSIRL